MALNLFYDLPLDLQYVIWDKKKELEKQDKDNKIIKQCGIYNKNYDQMDWKDIMENLKNLGVSDNKVHKLLDCVDTTRSEYFRSRYLRRNS